MNLSKKRIKEENYTKKRKKEKKVEKAKLNSTLQPLLE
jgi:hypothetical protein